MKNIVFLLAFVTSFSTTAQTSGYYGKKNVVEFNTGMSLPLFNIFGMSYYNYMKVDGSRMKSGNNYFDFSFRASYMRANVGDFGFGFEYSNIHRNIPGATYFNDTIGKYMIFEKLGTTTHLFMPKLELTTDNGLLPVGLSHQFGIGYGRTSIKAGEHAYGTTIHSDLVPKGSSIPITGTVTNAANFDLVATSLTILYEMHVKVPVSKSITVNYGFRYNVNIGLGSKYVNTNNYYLTNSEAVRSIQRSNLRSVISFNIGVGYVF